MERKTLWEIPLKKTENQTPHKPTNLEEIAVSVLMNSRF